MGLTKDYMDILRERDIKSQALEEAAETIERQARDLHETRLLADRLTREISRLNAALRWANDMLSPENRATLQRILEGR